MTSLPPEDKYELERRRLADAVSESVEKELKKRYSWIGIALAVAAFVGGATIIRGLTKDLEVQIELGKTTLTEIKTNATATADEANKLAAQTHDMLGNLDEQLAQISTQVTERTTEIDQLFASKKSTLDNLSQTSQQLEDFGKRLDNLTSIVESLAKQSSADTSKEVAATLDTLKQQQISLAKAVTVTSNQIQRSQYSIYVHYLKRDETGKTIGAELSDYLAKNGYIIPDVREVDQKTRSVRYFFPEDRMGAEAIAQATDDFWRRLGRPDIHLQIQDLTDFPGKKPRPGVIEVWFFL